MIIEAERARKKAKNNCRETERNREKANKREEERVDRERDAGPGLY